MGMTDLWLNNRPGGFNDSQLRDCPKLNARGDAIQVGHALAQCGLVVEQIGNALPIPFVGPQGFVDHLGMLPVFLDVDSEAQIFAVQFNGQRNQSHVEQFGMRIQVPGHLVAIELPRGFAM